MAGVVGLAGLAFVLIRLARIAAPEKELSLRVPEHITPFTVLGLLRYIQRTNGLSNAGQQELATAIRRVEQHYFGNGNGPEQPDLKSIAESWVAKTR
jgi:hypothetical protein